MCWLSGWRVETSLFNHPKHITHVLHHDPGDVGHGIDVVFGVVGEAGAGDEVEVFEDGVEAFGDAGVEFAQWGIGVDQEDRVVGGGVGHVGVVVERILFGHFDVPFVGKNDHRFAAKQMGGGCERVRRPEKRTKSPADPKISRTQSP